MLYKVVREPALPGNLESVYKLYWEEKNEIYQIHRSSFILVNFMLARFAASGTDKAKHHIPGNSSGPQRDIPAKSTTGQTG